MWRLDTFDDQQGEDLLEILATFVANAFQVRYNCDWSEWEAEVQLCMYHRIMDRFGMEEKFSASTCVLN